MTTPDDQGDKPWLAPRGDPPSGAYEAPPIANAPTQSSYERPPAPPPPPPMQSSYAGMPPAPPPPPPTPVAPNTRGMRSMALATLCISVLGLVLSFIIPGLGLIAGFVGAIWGSVALKDTRSGGKEYDVSQGRGLARSAIIVGVIAVVLAIFAWG